MATRYTFDKQSTRRISDAVRRVEDTTLDLTGRSRKTARTFDGWYHFKNNGSQAIPAYGVMRVESSTTAIPGDKHHKLLKCVRPDTTFARIYAVNGPEEVPVSGYGLCRLPPFDNVEVLYDTANTPAVGEGWGPQPDSFKLKQFYPATGIVIAELSDLEGAETMLVSWQAIIDGYAKADATIANDATGTISLWHGNFAGDSTVNITGAYNAGTEVASGDKLYFSFPNGKAGFSKLCS